MSTPKRLPAWCHGVSGRHARILVALWAALALSGCGGGGGGGDGDTLEVSLSYEDSAQLFKAVRISPRITGLRGHDPDCSLASGTLPAGMKLHSDCSISGTPLESGSFSFAVRLGASGVSNELEWQASLLVMGPSVIYSIPSLMTAGATYDLGLLNTIFWQPTPADEVSYSVVEGTLPPGLAVDRVTGHIAGTPTTDGVYSFKIGAKVVNAGRTARAVQTFSELVTVRTPEIPYYDTTAWAGLPFSSQPSIPSYAPAFTFSAAALPPGLSIDAVTGVISGRPAIVGDATYRIDLTSPTAGGGTFTTSTQLYLSVLSPVDIAWSWTGGTKGVPFSSDPVFQNFRDDPLTGISYDAYAVHPGSALPLGLVLDAGTGRISGTPLAEEQMISIIDVTITLYGTTFVAPVEVQITIYPFF